MSANILSQAIRAIKTNPQKKEQTKTDTKTGILSRIKKPNELVIKEQVGGRKARQAENQPYSKAIESVKKILGGRFIPKSELVAKSEVESRKWKHDLCPKQDTGKHRVFVRGVPAGITNDELRRIFEVHGNVLGINIAGQTADIYFGFKEDAQKAINSQTVIRGEKVKLMLCESKTKSVDSKSKPEIHEKVIESERAKNPESILSRIKKPSAQ